MGIDAPKDNSSLYNSVENGCASVRSVLKSEALTKSWSVFIKEADKDSNKEISVAEFSIWVKNNANQGKLMLGDTGIDMTNLSDEAFVKMFETLAKDEAFGYLADGQKEAGANKEVRLSDGDNLLNSVVKYLPQNSTVNETLAFFESCVILDQVKEGYFTDLVKCIVESASKNNYAKMATLTSELFDTIGKIPNDSKEIIETKAIFVGQLIEILRNDAILPKLIQHKYLDAVIEPYLSDKVGLNAIPTYNSIVNNNYLSYSAMPELLDAVFDYAKTNPVGFNSFFGVGDGTVLYNTLINLPDNKKLMKTISKNKDAIADYVAEDYLSRNPNNKKTAQIIKGLVQLGIPIAKGTLEIWGFAHKATVKVKNIQYAIGGETVKKNQEYMDAKYSSECNEASAWYWSTRGF